MGEAWAGTGKAGLLKNAWIDVWVAAWTFGFFGVCSRLGTRLGESALSALGAGAGRWRLFPTSELLWDTEAVMRPPAAPASGAPWPLLFFFVLYLSLKRSSSSISFHSASMLSCTGVLPRRHHVD